MVKMCCKKGSLRWNFQAYVTEKWQSTFIFINASFLKGKSMQLNYMQLSYLKLWHFFFFFKVFHRKIDIFLIFFQLHQIYFSIIQHAWKNVKIINNNYNWVIQNSSKMRDCIFLPVLRTKGIIAMIYFVKEFQFRIKFQIQSMASTELYLTKIKTWKEILWKEKGRQCD